MHRRWHYVVLGLLGVLLVPTAAGAWPPEPLPPVDGHRLAGVDGVESETATLAVTPDGDGRVTLTVHATETVAAADLRDRLTSRLAWEYGDRAAGSVRVSADGDRVTVRYLVPEVATPGPGDTMIVDVLAPIDHPQPRSLSVDRLTIEGPAWGQTVGSDDPGAIVLTRDEAVEPRIEPRLVAFAPAGARGALAGHVGLYQYRALASLGLYAGLATWLLVLFGVAMAFVWTGPRIEQSPRVLDRFEAGYIALTVLGLFGTGIALTNPDLPSLVTTPVAAPVAAATALAPLVLAGAWVLVGSERGPQIDPDRFGRWAATLGIGVIVTAPLVAGIESPLTGPYRVLAGLVPAAGAIPVVVGRGRYRAVMAIGLLGAPIAVAIAAPPTLLAPDIGPVYKLYALVVGACLLAAAQIDRRRLLDWQPTETGPSTDALTPDT